MRNRSISPRILEVGSWHIRCICTAQCTVCTCTHTDAYDDAVKDVIHIERDSEFTYMHATSALNTNKAVHFPQKENATVFGGVFTFTMFSSS